MCADSSDFAGRGLMQLYMGCKAQYSLCEPTFTFAELKQKAGRTFLSNPSGFGPELYTEAQWLICRVPTQFARILCLSCYRPCLY